MIFQNVRIKTLKLIGFAGKRDLFFELDEKTNVFIGENCCGKTTLCDFIRFMFYGTEGKAELFPWDGNKTVSGEMELVADGVLFKIHRAEALHDPRASSRAVISDKDGTPLGIDVSPGEYFLGIDSFLYDRTMYLPQKQNNKIQTDLDLDALDRWGKAFSGKDKLYSSYDAVIKERSLLMNDDKTGELDILLNERSIAEKMSEDLEKTRAQCTAEETLLEDIKSKVVSNNKRIVIIKANMKNFADDIKLTENRENASSLKAEIASNEKRAKILGFEAQSALPGLTRDDIASVIASYTDYSRLSAELSEAEAKLEIAQENYEVNNRLFSEDSRDEIEDVAASLENKRHIKNLFTSFATLFVLTGIFVFCYLYFLAERELIFSAIVGGGVLLFSVILFIAAALFRNSSANILRDMNMETQAEFDELYEQYMSFRKTEELYGDALETAKADHMRISSLASETLHSVRKLFDEKTLEKQKNDTASLASLTLTFEIPQKEEEENAPGVSYAEMAESEFVSKIDEVISRYNTFFELEDEIERQKADYKQLLSRDVQRDTLEISDEFRLLERELSFLTKQNTALFNKRNETEKHLEVLRASLIKKTAEVSGAKSNEKNVLATLERYRDLQMKYERLKGEIGYIEGSVLQPISARVNALMSFALKQGESFIIGENFEFKYKRDSRTMPFSRAGGGLSELALIALRIAVTEQLIKGKTPMIFDESFMYIDRDNAKHLCRITEAEGRQLLIFTSLENDHIASFTSPKVFTSEDF